MKKMPRIRVSLWVTAAVIIAAILAISIFLSRDASPSVFPVSENTVLTINTGDASVFISVESRMDMEVIGHHTRGLQVDSSGNSITISAGGRGIVEVSVPSWIRVKSIDISTTKGDIVVESVLAEEISLSSGSGSMMITETSSATIDGESVSGNIILTDTTSKTARLNNTAGFLRAIGTLGNIDASTESGSIYIVPIGDGVIKAETNSGNVNIIAGERSLMWETAAGSAKIYGEAMPTAGGTEDAKVTVSTNTGNITIDK